MPAGGGDHSGRGHERRAGTGAGHRRRGQRGPTKAGVATTPAALPPLPAPGGWLPVDAAAQVAAKAACFAMFPKPVTGNPVKVPELNAGCKVSHHGSDDPIVLPGLAGASHNHTFIGNKTTNARSTAESLGLAGLLFFAALSRTAHGGRRRGRGREE
jgi:hypothetical protein